MAQDSRTVRTDSRFRANIATLGLILIAGVCVARLGYWQVVARDQLLDAAAAQLARERTLAFFAKHLA